MVQGIVELLFDVRQGWAIHGDEGAARLGHADPGEINQSVTARETGGRVGEITVFGRTDALDIRGRGGDSLKRWSVSCSAVPACKCCS